MIFIQRMSGKGFLKPARQLTLSAGGIKMGVIIVSGENFMNDILLLKQGEIVLKGLNRKYFEQKLISNINRRLSRIGRFRV